MTQHPSFTISPDDPVFRPEDTDPSKSPADDFYRFANGGWLDANPVPDEYGSWGAFHELNARNEDVLHAILESVAKSGESGDAIARLVGDYYRSGMDIERIEQLDLEPIQTMLDTIATIDATSDLATVVADMHMSGLGAFLDVAVIPDFEDATVNLLYVGQSGLGLPDRDYYLRDDETSRQLLAHYVDHVGDMFDLLGFEDHEGAARTVLAIETSIAEMSYTNVQMRDVQLTTNKVQHNAASTLMPVFELDRYLDAIGAGDERSFNIDNEGFYPALDALIERTPIKDLRTYLIWNVVRGTSSALPQRFQDEAFNFYGMKLGGQKAQKVRWKRVLAAASSDIGQLVSQLYVVENFPPEAKVRMEGLVENLLTSMRSSIEGLTWMSEATKVEALEKLSGFGYKIGYPDEWRDYTGLEVARGTWLSNREAAARFEFARQMGTLGQPVDPHEWSMAPHVVNAYYHPLRNEIVFPAGILQAPFFRLDADDAVNYGSIGAVIGHEITHGFDDQGSRFDANGNVRDWWTATDREEFDSRARVVVDQYNEYEIEDGLTVNGELTLGENIADLGGLRVARAALLTALDGDTGEVAGLSADQRFYLSYASIWRQNYTDEYLRLLVNSDPHSPGYSRCIGPLSNLASFAEAFGLDPDSAAMRPISERVDIW
ncbi:MAG: M13 family metallopeptidase [Actinomycetia bacterium]|nr:M13 family metallopeptidase [Actinomycetes bacterium]